MDPDLRSVGMIAHFHFVEIRWDHLSEVRFDREIQWGLRSFLDFRPGKSFQEIVAYLLKLAIIALGFLCDHTPHNS